MFVITHLMQAMKRLYVVDQSCAFSSGRPEHTVVHFSRHALNGEKQLLEGGGWPHQGPTWIFTRPQNVMFLAKKDQLAGDMI